MPPSIRSRHHPDAPGPLVGCLAAVLLHLPAFRYQLLSDDEAIYDAMAQVVSRGGVMYRDTVDHKPPGLTYTYAAVRSVVEHLGGGFPLVLAGVHLVGIAFVVATCWALHRVARHVLEARLWGLPPLLYALFSAANIAPDSLAVNGEMLMALPTVLAVWCVLAAADDRATRRVLLWILGGAFCALAALYKYQAALVGLALLAVPAKDARTHVARAVCLAVGFAMPFVVVALYFSNRGALAEAIDWGILFNRNYLKEGPGLQMAASRLAAQLFGVVLPSLLFFAAGFATLWRILRRRPAPGVVAGRAMLAVWALEAIYCFTLGRRFFGHYLLQPELPLALLAAGPVAAAFEARPRLTLMGMVAPAAVFFGVNVLPELTSRVVYGDPDYRTVGRAAAARTRPDERIWVWGNVPQIYYAAEREPGVRFTFCNYLTGLSPGTPSEYDPKVDPRADAVAGAWDMVVADLDVHRPALVLDTAAAGMKSYGKFPVSSFPVLARYLDTHYRIEGSVNGVVFYRRIDST
ncbi:MAG TPA: hypothetical protein VF765_31340 [Polyangiaceae bacterium]